MLKLILSKNSCKQNHRQTWRAQGAGAQGGDGAFPFERSFGTFPFERSFGAFPFERSFGTFVWNHRLNVRLEPSFGTFVRTFVWNLPV